jgi:serine/threonine-protein kinase
VRVLDFGWISPDRPYYAMERLEGATLDRVLDQATPLSPITVCASSRTPARRSRILHKNGIVHRDVKPSNIFVAVGHGRRRPRPRLLDLGVAGVFDARKAKKLGTVNVRRRGSYGTPAYIAPEQVLGLPTDERADVYGLACVTYRMPHRLRAVPLTRPSEETVEAHLFAQAHPGDRDQPDAAADGRRRPSRAMTKERGQRTRRWRRFVAELRKALAPRKPVSK